MTRSTRFMPRSPLAIAPHAWGIELFEFDARGNDVEEVGAYAVVAIEGPLAQHAAWYCDGYDAIADRVTAALASNAPALLLRISSPGGEVYGCFELADHIKDAAAAAGKPVVAYVDGAATSAAYALACAAGRIVVPSTGVVGSIGTITMAVDATKADDQFGLKFHLIASGARKTDANPHVALSDDARASVQSKIDQLAEIFFKHVSASRGKSVDEIRAYEADTFVGAQAVSVGLADEVGTFASLVAASPLIASQAKESIMTDEEKAKAALKSLAECDDEKQAARAKKALAALAEEEEEKKDDEAKAEGGEGDEEKKDDEAKAKAEDEEDTSAKATLALAAQVQMLSKKIADRDEREERAKLMASRTDLADEVVALLDRSPLAVVRDAVKTLPRGAAKGQVGAAIAAIGVAPSVTGKSEQAVRQLPPEQHDALMREMGVLPPKQESGPRADGSYVFPTLVPSELRKQMKGGE